MHSISIALVLFSSHHQSNKLFYLKGHWSVSEDRGNGRSYIVYTTRISTASYIVFKNIYIVCTLIGFVRSELTTLFFILMLLVVKFHDWCHWLTMYVTPVPFKYVTDIQCVPPDRVGLQKWMITPSTYVNTSFVGDLVLTKSVAVGKRLGKRYCRPHIAWARYHYVCLRSHRLKRSHHNCIVLKVCHTLCVLRRMAVMTFDKTKGRQQESRLKPTPPIRWLLTTKNFNLSVAIGMKALALKWTRNQ